mgnify:CR=1 FL=1
MTAMPAARLGLNDRGVIEVGRKADIAVFDPAVITDHATYDDPKQLCTGLHATLINGKLPSKKILCAAGTAALPSVNNHCVKRR